MGWTSTACSSWLLPWRRSSLASPRWNMKACKVERANGFCGERLSRGPKGVKGEPLRTEGLHVGCDVSDCSEPHELSPAHRRGTLPLGPERDALSYREPCCRPRAARGRHTGRRLDCWGARTRNPRES